ncbi:GntR family transcriptional regulator [Kiloniella laminariae]|uniref:GntR family transcriptional regulator n=1 Tax=Kiloniella laminariae TaxID=454162 RepID=A0ABT4LGR7_9PROT|nr:GntR family transcriptional regulator [Kiloniella laminariae]MCZ4280297.1 GntR family transcriptional regulator [Kiloniella laminariae]
MNNKEVQYNLIKRRILTLELEPGSDLDEATICKESGLSRTPVREILQKLAGEGYIRLVGNRGASVASMNHKTLRDFFRTAPMIYSVIGRLAAQNATPEQIAVLKKIQNSFKEAVKAEDAEAMVTYNNQFHAQMGEMANNQYLLPSLNRLLIDHARIAQTFYRPTDAQSAQNLKSSCEHHDQFIEAIEQRDEDRTVSITQAHWDLSRSHMELYIHPGPLEADCDF